jgi:hypothetical protein
MTDIQVLIIIAVVLIVRNSDPIVCHSLGYTLLGGAVILGVYRLCFM